MLSFLPSFILGPLSFGIFIANTVFWCLIFYVVVLAKVLVPLRGWRNGCTSVLTRIAELWTSGNNRGIELTQNIQWDVKGVENLSRKAWYMVSCNHQSWIDIVVLQRIFNRRIPFPKFFLKKELIWVPVLGGTWWALDFPFMKRHSKAYLEKHPEKRGEDLERTRKACERYRHYPVTILNFLEGTRFTPAKHEKQASPYRHLLRPKAGGIASALSVMGDKLSTLLDVTIVYPENRVRFWDLFSGKLRRVVVRVKTLSIPQEFLGGDYTDNPELRERFQAWVRELWQEKDALIESVMAQHRGVRLAAQ